jgi:hypothetical protein
MDKRISFYIYANNLDSFNAAIGDLYPKEVIFNYICYLLDTKKDFSFLVDTIKKQDLINSNSKTKQLRVRIKKEELEIIKYFYKKVKLYSDTDFSLSKLINALTICFKDITTVEYNYKVKPAAYNYVAKYNSYLKINTIIDDQELSTKVHDYIFNNLEGADNLQLATELIMKQLIADSLTYYLDVYGLGEIDEK